MGQPVVGIHQDTNQIVPISKVTKAGLKCHCKCYSCEGELEAVINTWRRKHFRHSNKTNCKPSPETELHLIAKTVILNNTQINIPGMGMADYIDPVCEVRSNNLVPDAIIMLGGSPLYIEIVVTNPIDATKYKKYQANNSRVLVIDLQEEDRSLDYETLESLVINDTTNRHILSYQEVRTDVLESEQQSLWRWGIGIVLSLLGILIFINRPGSNNSKRTYRSWKKKYRTTDKPT